ncbi:MAG: hypothetical protein FWF87_02505 [Synergistaceae bacterium]|nr:hypothetical protein [Synergistaceae bacterium]
MKKYFFAALLLLAFSFASFSAVWAADEYGRTVSDDNITVQEDPISIDATSVDEKEDTASDGKDGNGMVAGSGGSSSVTAAVTPSLKLAALPRGSLTLPGIITLTATLSGAFPDDSGKTVTFNVKGNTHTEITNASGIAIFTIYNPSADIYDFSVFSEKNAENNEAAATLTGYTVKSPDQDVISIIESRYGYLIASIVLLVMLIIFAKNRKKDE